MWTRVTFPTSEWPDAYDPGIIQYQGDFGANLMRWADNSATVYWEGDPYQYNYPENAAYYKVWKKDYRSLTDVPAATEVYDFAWEYAHPANMSGNTAWWSGWYRNVPESAWEMHGWVATPTSITHWIAPAQVGDMDAHGLYPISDSEGLWCGLYREPLMSGWGRMGIWKVTSAGSSTQLGSYIYAYEYSGAAPPYVDHTPYYVQYDPTTDRGIWFFNDGDYSAYQNFRYLIFSTSGATAFNVIDVGSFSTLGFIPHGVASSRDSYWPIQSGKLLIRGYDAGAYPVTTTPILYELDITGSTPTVTNSAAIPVGLQTASQQYYTTTGVAGMIGADFYSGDTAYGWFVWDSPFSGSEPRLIDIPQADSAVLRYEPGTFLGYTDEQWIVQYPWVMAFWVYEDVNGSEVFFNNSVWIGQLGEVPNLDGSLTEKERKFWRNRPY